MLVSTPLLFPTIQTINRSFITPNQHSYPYELHGNKMLVLSLAPNIAFSGPGPDMRFEGTDIEEDKQPI